MNWIILGMGSYCHDLLLTAIMMKFDGFSIKEIWELDKAQLKHALERTQCI